MNLELSGPHVGTDDTIEKTMWNVALALIPAAIAAAVFFGYYALFLIFSTAIFSVLLEYPFTKRFPGDGSAFVTGMLLGMSIPASSPFWLPLIGAFFAIIVAKQLFGGLGNNVFNPALAGRAVIRLSFPALFAKWPAPFDGITGATPLAQRAADSSYTYLSQNGLSGFWNLFSGNIPGAIGETSALALLIGAAFLYYKGYISWRIPGSFITAVIITSAILGVNPILSVFAGAVILGSFFMATDMVSSPAAKEARLFYGAGCGALTVLIRYFSSYSGGVTFAILTMNGLAYLTDHLFEGFHFGQHQIRKRNYKIAGAALTGAGIIILFSYLAQLVG
ncbi:MAG: RnfABCDGE type electron transport complex subunit D [bacterium]